MIHDLDFPEYYVTSVNIDINPKIGKTVQGQVSSQLEIDNPEIHAEPEGLRCEATLELDLYRDGEAPWQDTGSEENDRFGEIEIETIIFISGTKSKIEQFYENWQDESYHNLDDDFIHHVESGILHQVINPVGDLIEKSYNGVVPRMRFSPPKENQTE